MLLYFFIPIGCVNKDSAQTRHLDCVFVCCEYIDYLACPSIASYCFDICTYGRPPKVSSTFGDKV